MSETGRGGINRPLSWIKRVLQITEKTVVPDRILPEVRPTIDTFGWERLADETISANAFGGLTATVVNTVAVPEGVMRLLISCSILTNDPLLVGFLAIEVVSDGVGIAIQAPFLLVAGDDGVRFGLERRVLLAPGDVLRGVSQNAPAAATRIELQSRHLDIPIGEYLPAI